MKAVTATDASVEDEKMEEHWTIANEIERDVLSNELCYKKQKHDALGLTKVIVLLELLVVLEKGDKT